MKNETVTLSRDLAERIEHLLLDAFGGTQAGTELRAALAEPVPPAVVATGMPYNQAVAVWFSAATKGAPVPPAGGEVEVVAWRSSDAFGAVYAYEPDRPADEYHGLVTLEDHHAHVTRLQAEVELLKLDLRLSEQTKQKFIEANETFGNLAFEKMTLKAELTKARERVHELEHAIFHALDDSIEYEALIDEVAITKLDFEKLNALLPEDWEHRQSAPAAKDENKS
jgi:hypothetical protein